MKICAKFSNQSLSSVSLQFIKNKTEEEAFAVDIFLEY